MVAPSAVVKNLVMKLDLCQPKVVLGEGLKDIHGQCDLRVSFVSGL